MERKLRSRWIHSAIVRTPDEIAAVRKQEAAAAQAVYTLNPTNTSATSQNTIIGIIPHVSSRLEEHMSTQPAKDATKKERKKMPRGSIRPLV